MPNSTVSDDKFEVNAFITAQDSSGQSSKISNRPGKAHGSVFYPARFIVYSRLAIL